METEPDQSVEDNTQSGKRKRLSDPDVQHSRHEYAHDGNYHISGSLETGVASDVLKRPRVGSGRLRTPHDPRQMSTSESAYYFPTLSFPIELLQYIMSFVDPFSLGRLMRVNRYLCDILDPTKGLKIAANLHSRIPYKTVEDVWMSSRKSHVPGMPHPLKPLTELEMFKLIYGKRCQKCGTLPKALVSSFAPRPWSSGPGPSGVRTIWPFKMRLCANCLRSLTLKEEDLMQQGLAHLKAGLLSASFTPSLHYVMSITVNQGLVPRNVNITRYYFRPHIEALLHSAPHPQTSERSVQESWFQQTDASRQEAITDTVRLEAWELSQTIYIDTATVPYPFKSRSSASGSSVYSDNVTKSYLSASSTGFKPALSSGSGFASSLLSGSQDWHSASGHLFTQPASSASTKQPQLISSSGSMLPISHTDSPIKALNPRSEYGSLDIMRLKAEKEDEIKKRCLQLNPSISPSVVSQCPSFLSAIQNFMPLDDTSWEKLKIELLSQSRLFCLSASKAESNRHHDTVDSATVRRTMTPPAEHVELDLREQAFRPVREKLSAFAREYVHRRYAGGFDQTHASAPQFAADILVYVRQRFYENQAQEDAAFHAHGQLPPDEGPSGIRTRTLKLEHMRYVFESSIKPYTEFVRKDLFLCRACDTQGRHFAFEAIIQHYASKHTDEFSLGNAVVYWKSEWPVQPPFEPRPGKHLEFVTSSYSRSDLQPGFPPLSQSSGEVESGAQKLGDIPISTPGWGAHQPAMIEVGVAGQTSLHSANVLQHYPTLTTTHQMESATITSHRTSPQYLSEYGFNDLGNEPGRTVLNSGSRELDTGSGDGQYYGIRNRSPVRVHYGRDQRHAEGSTPDNSVYRVTHDAKPHPLQDMAPYSGQPSNSYRQGDRLLNRDRIHDVESHSQLYNLSEARSASTPPRSFQLDRRIDSLPYQQGTITRLQHSGDTRAYPNPLYGSGVEALREEAEDFLDSFDRDTAGDRQTTTLAQALHRQSPRPLSGNEFDQRYGLPNSRSDVIHLPRYIQGSAYVNAEPRLWSHARSESGTEVVGNSAYHVPRAGHFPSQDFEREIVYVNTSDHYGSIRPRNLHVHSYDDRVILSRSLESPESRYRRRPQPPYYTNQMEVCSAGSEAQSTHQVMYREIEMERNTQQDGPTMIQSRHRYPIEERLESNSNPETGQRYRESFVRDHAIASQAGPYHNSRVRNVNVNPDRRFEHPPFEPMYNPRKRDRHDMN